MKYIPKMFQTAIFGLSLFAHIVSKHFGYKYLIFLSILLTPVISVLAATHHPQDFLQSIQNSPREGEKIVQHFCANCHAEKPLIQLGAPRIGCNSDWKLRLKQGLDILLKHTEEGFNAMPARGGCFECSDEQLKLAIEAMLPRQDSKK